MIYSLLPLSISQAVSFSLSKLVLESSLINPIQYDSFIGTKQNYRLRITAFSAQLCYGRQLNCGFPVLSPLQFKCTDSFL